MAYDRRITLQQKTTIKDAWGGEKDGYEDLETVWAEFNPTSDAEKFRAGQAEATSMGWFRVRYSAVAALIGPRDQVMDAGKAWKIVGVKQIGRRRSIEFTATHSDATGS
ncbi:putative phage head-tail adaptor [Thalassovita gelatinovora]|uniref:Putative phage head-tail adaptor n=1 Tax=Thalassovita gelatinovora TaxID=53501 RepID=A0A0P1G482_THAGE|nr:phage head closure protein [Thalassovita gelatinovora]QIZ79072.1 phage head closure protein [Thalassovita gelatinovora]CUH68687.1 putative phage head-tail adaptor [Thalassovita gelatinovora]SEQ56710.1 phage head-tail adaptor, putative, SPP1 family [Thalassovita gelatinovora]